MTESRSLFARPRVRARLTRKEHEGIFLDYGNVLYLYHGGGYNGVKFVRTNKMYVLNECALLYVNYTS